MVLIGALTARDTLACSTPFLASLTRRLTFTLSLW